MHNRTETTKYIRPQAALRQRMRRIGSTSEISLHVMVRWLRPKSTTLNRMAVRTAHRNVTRARILNLLRLRANERYRSNCLSLLATLTPLLTPPLTIAEAELESALGILEGCVGEVE